jgi:hypothetical protein
MRNEINTIAQQLFHKENFDGVTEDDLWHFVSKYPYVAPARFLFAKRKFNSSDEQPHTDVITAGLYFNNPLWLNWQLADNEPEEIAPPQPQPVAAQPKTEEEPLIAFQSYHTIDYFASQGIRLQQADLTKDKLGQQLKSFTEWLRSMKKLPSAEGQVAGPEDDNRQQVVIMNAASSIEEKEVVTEAMAEVWVKQGHNEKAAEIYRKLSLQNPSKSSYFAAKIDQLK